MDDLPQEAFGDYDEYGAIGLETVGGYGGYGGYGKAYVDDDKDILGDQDYGDFNEEQEYEAESNAYDRVGPGGKMSELLQSTSGDQKLSNPNMSQEDRFIILVDAAARDLNQRGIAAITDSDIETIRNSTQKITGLKYKNYLAYILGYLASDGGKDLKPKIVKNVIENILPKLNGEAGVYPADVIRYARFWNKFL